MADANITLKDALKQLEALGNEKVRAHNKKNGARFLRAVSLRSPRSGSTKWCVGKVEPSNETIETLPCSTMALGPCMSIRGRNPRGRQ